MKYRLLDILICECGKTFNLENPKVEASHFVGTFAEVRCKHLCGMKGAQIGKVKVTPDDCARCYRLEIEKGVLRCECGRSKEVFEGIPRFLPESLGKDFKSVQKTFSYEWKMFRFGDRNWGQDIEFRKNLFLQGIESDPKHLEGKLILDAGCGSGLLSMEMANSFRMEVVALDLAFGIEKAYRYNRNPFVHFVQGSVLNLPFRIRHFDLLYCAGVLVALPDTRTGFKSIIRVLKNGGRCFIWVYHPINERYHHDDLRKIRLYNMIRKHITSKINIRWQYYLYLLLMPAFFVKQKLDIYSGVKKSTINIYEKMQALFDMFSPIYQNRHTFEEVVDWFKEEGFTKVKISDIGPYGFGTKGDLTLIESQLWIPGAR
jgi:ubiquinone/menaquinone biosynthesis C-methylase UbiE